MPLAISISICSSTRSFTEDVAVCFRYVQSQPSVRRKVLFDLADVPGTICCAVLVVEQLLLLYVASSSTPIEFAGGWGLSKPFQQAGDGGFVERGTRQPHHAVIPDLNDYHPGNQHEQVVMHLGMTVFYPPQRLIN